MGKIIKIISVVIGLALSTAALFIDSLYATPAIIASIYIVYVNYIIELFKRDKPIAIPVPVPPPVSQPVYVPPPPPVQMVQPNPAPVIEEPEQEEEPMTFDNLINTPQPQEVQPSQKRWVCRMCGRKLFTKKALGTHVLDEHMGYGGTKNG